MAAKRIVTRSRSNKRQEAELRELLRRARAETTKLLKRKQARTVTRRGSGKLREAETTLRKLLGREHAEVANLLKRNRAGTITRVELHSGLEELDIGFQEVETRIKRMLNHVFYML
jgi:hypothetical protein